MHVRCILSFTQFIHKWSYLEVVLIVKSVLFIYSSLMPSPLNIRQRRKEWKRMRVGLVPHHYQLNWQSLDSSTQVFMPKPGLFLDVKLVLVCLSYSFVCLSIPLLSSLCPRHKMARGHLVFALSVIPSFRPSVLPSFRPSFASKFVFSTPPTSLHGFEWNLVQMLYDKSRSACGEIIHVRQILAELWSLTLRIFTHLSLSSQLLLHPCMDLNETW